VYFSGTAGRNPAPEGSASYRSKSVKTDCVGFTLDTVISEPRNSSFFFAALKLCVEEICADFRQAQGRTL
jgi:hypothetical protein